MTFQNDGECCVIAAKRHVACVMSRANLFVIKLNLLPDYEKCGNAVIRLSMPKLTGSQHVTAAIHGRTLYIAEALIMDGAVMLHCTDVNTLLKLKTGDDVTWRELKLKLKSPVLEHFRANIANVKMKLFSTTAENLDYKMS